MTAPDDSRRGDSVPLCPSAQPDWHGAVAIGVIEGTAEKPLMVHFRNTVPVDEKLLDLAKPVTPTEVFRFAARCVEGRCVHFRNDRCNLVTQIVNLLPNVTESFVPCAVRAQCRWWSQEGKSACARCSQVVTDNYNPSREMRHAATPGAGQSAECHS
jgi:hypothetical protein